MAKKKKTLLSKIKSAIKKVVKNATTKTTSTKKTTADKKSVSSPKNTPSKEVYNAVKKVQSAGQKNNVLSENLSTKNKETSKQINSLKTKSTSQNNAVKSIANQNSNNTLKKAIKKLVTETKKTDTVTGRFRTTKTKQKQSAEKIGEVAEKVTKKATTADELVGMGVAGLESMKKSNDAITRAVKKAAEKKKKDEENKLTKDERYKLQAATLSAANAERGQRYDTVKIDEKTKKKIKWNTQRDLDNASDAKKFLHGYASGVIPFTDTIKNIEKIYGIKVDGEEFKKSGYYKTGDVLGFITSSIATGAGLESATAKTLTKAVTKVAGKKVAEKTGTKVATGIAADVASGLPMNIADASENTNNSKDFLKNLGINTALDAGVSGLISGVRLLKGVKTKEVQAVADKVKAGKALNASDKKVLDDLKKIADDSLKQAENAKVLEKQSARNYNTNQGGIDNGKEQVRTNNLSDDIGRTEDIQQAESGVQLSGRVGTDRRGVTGSNGNTELGGTRRSSSNVLLNSTTKEKMNASGIVDTKLDGSDYATFSSRLDKAISQNPHGSYVDPQPVDNLTKANAKVFLSDDGSVGIAVKEDGDICGAFNAGTKYKGAVSDMLITARANGGTKMDCYGKRLVNMYERSGFVPVARVKFDPTYVDDPLLLRNQPDVYIMMKNSDSIDAVVDNVANKAYKMSSPEDLNKLPIFEYDEAMAYRDKLLAEQEAKINGGTERLNAKDYPNAKSTAVNLQNQVNDETAETIRPWIEQGLMDKKKLESQVDAMAKAKAELDDGSLYKNFMDGDPETNEHLFMARAAVLMDDMSSKVGTSEYDEMLLKVFSKATEGASMAGRLLNATKMLYRSTPEGKVKLFEKEVDNLNKAFGHRIKDGELKLSDEQKNMIKNATSEEEIDEIAEKITKEMWDKIPATKFEKFNEIRHCSMLFNPKTHIRNFTGNLVFKAGRTMAEGMELAIYKMPGVQKKLKKLASEGGGLKTSVADIRVTHKEIKAHKDILNEIFDNNYGQSGSKNQYIESTRPDGTTAVNNKAIGSIIQANYKALEKEDMLIFKPEYRKHFVRWCKMHDVPLDKMADMPPSRMIEANKYAMRQAEYATFRDNSVFASKIVGLKQKTATKTGKTATGTALYRTGNMMLESTLPFVKTPVNILRRSVDFSPAGMAKGISKLRRATTVDEFMTGVKNFTSGLTGTGVLATGMLLAKNDLITVKTGEVSGDEYYDRDIGYQDYSLIVHLDGKKYSVTVDWVAPMQTSLFMGATMFELIDDYSAGEFSLADMFDCLYAVSGPMLDMSFMSSTKDTIKMFMDKMYNDSMGDGMNFGEAIAQTLFGSIPQGYLNSFIPQIFSQTAQATDKYQRDTRSTKEDPIAKSWESFGRKIANRIPGLRNYILNPKSDRFGNDKVTGNNIVLRFINSYLNPANVKEINLTRTDKEIIDIYNHLEDGDVKKHFYYNFTGNPSYDLGNGKRMTYDQAYKYGKAKRINQTELIESMLNAKSYKNMTYKMKGYEISNAHWISQTIADWKTYGAKFAVKRVIDFSDSEKNAYTKFSSIGGNNKEFIEAYIEKEKLISRAHDSSYQTKALVLATLGDDRLAKAYGVYGDKMKPAKEYLKKGGTITEYSNAMCNIISTIQKKAGTSTSLPSKALAAAEYKINMRTYNAMGIDSQLANMGVGLKKFGYDFQKLDAMEMAALVGFDADGNNSLKKAEIIAYIESLGLETNAEKACVFRYFSEAKNPYGSIPNYLNMKDVSTSSSGSHRRHSSSSKKSSSSSKSKSTSSKTELSDFEKYTQRLLKDIQSGKFVDNPSYSKLTNKYSDSYRKAIAKLLAKKLKES